MNLSMLMLMPWYNPLFRTVLGDFDYDQLREADRVSYQFEMIINVLKHWDFSFTSDFQILWIL